MKSHTLLIILLSSIVIVLTACSSNDSNKDAKGDYAAGNDMGIESEDAEKSKSDAIADGDSSESSDIPSTRMIIQRAELQLKVKSFEQAQLNIEKKVGKYGGYIVESNVYRDNDETVSGGITVRVPEKDFQNFLSDAEEEAADILKRIVTGENVTEQYVDLKSRLKSKRAVEERLLEFMSNAEKTEDLLKISSDLATIQEEIELIVGKMNYFENQTSFSTIEITMFENLVIVPSLDSKDLDTWEKTKKQLATSTNFLLATASGVIVFFIGNLPIIVLLVLIGAITYFVVKRKLGKKI